tara:strand:+ start:26 stop:496 length:471 start_codon:yes stop_codon:yes gene_type:complete
MSWFVAYTKFRSEFKASNFFERMGIMAYVPCFEEKRRWSDRIKKIRKPAISGYVFFRIEKLSYSKINVNPFVKNIVKSNGEVVKIKDSEIAQLKEALKLHSQADKYREGDRVQIESGVFKYRTAVVQSIDKNTITLLLNKLKLKLSLKRNDVRVAG